MMTVAEVLKTDWCCGAKLIAIAIIGGARTAREAAEACSMNVRTAERHYATVRISLRNIAGDTQDCVAGNTQNCVVPRARISYPEENIKTPIVPKQLDLAPPDDKPKVARKLARFNDWYALYPKKVGKAAAERAWPAAVKRAGSPETIIEALKLHLPALEAKDRQYVKNPSTWLNQACWEDDIEQPQRRRGKVTPEQLAGLSDEDGYALLRQAGMMGRH